MLFYAYIFSIKLKMNIADCEKIIDSFVSDSALNIVKIRCGYYSFWSCDKIGIN